VESHVVGIVRAVCTVPGSAAHCNDVVAFEEPINVLEGSILAVELVYED
jgi:hypothetical protein